MNERTRQPERCQSVSRRILGTVGIGLALLSSAALISCGLQSNGSAHAASNSPTKTIFIPIEGMSCQACAARVKSTLKEIDGVVEVEISLEHRDVRVRYVEDKTSPERLVAAINQLGYKAGTPRAAENAPPGASSDIKAALIPITGMSCEEMCVPKVKKALEALDGVNKVHVSLKPGNARVEYVSSKISPEKMASVIDGLGFKAGQPIVEAVR